MPDFADHPLGRLLRERIAIIDGAMGTMVQLLRKSGKYVLDEADFRGERFRDWSGKDQVGNNELLLLTKPEVILDIHTQYLEAGADLIETNTFGATTIGQNDFLFVGDEDGKAKDQAFFQRVIEDPFLRGVAREMNLAAAKLAREAVETVAARTGHRGFVAGAIGPMPVTASISGNVNDPA